MNSRISTLHHGTVVPPSFLFHPVRTRLLDEQEVGAVDQKKVLSMVAPVGYGKTVLMTQLHAQRQRLGQQCFWLGLGHRMVTVERVVQLLMAALGAPQSAHHPTQMLFAGDETLDRQIGELIETIATITAPATIFIDNLNSCTDEALGNLLDALIFRTSSTLRFVWSSTTVPPIDIGRAKLEGLLREVGFNDLNLNLEEAHQLLGEALTRQIGDAGTAAIVNRTEGWPAGVRLMQIALADAAEPNAVLADFSGSDEDVSAMLNRQVLNGFSPEIREFLLSLALLQTFSVDLCAHLFGTDNARHLLHLLLTRNVFIIPLDRNRKRYRFHGLFREYLLAEADHQLSPQRRHATLKLAAEWYEKNQEFDDAIVYALEAGEFEQASLILDQTGILFVRDRGDIHQYAHWIEQLLRSGTSIGWEAHFWYVWALIFLRRLGQGLQQQELLADRVHSHKGRRNPPPDDLLHRIDHLRICIELYSDRLESAYQRTESWLDSVKMCDPYNIGSVWTIKAIILTANFHFPEARQALRRAENIFVEIGGAYTMGWMPLASGIMSLYEGDFVVAHQLLGTALTEARAALGHEAILCGLIAFADARCAVEMGLQDEASNLLLSGLRTAHVHGLVDTASYGLETAIKLCDGTNGPVTLDRLRQIASHYPPRLAQMLSCFLVQRLLRLGHIDDALVESKKIEWLSVDTGSQQQALPRLRDLLAATAIELLIARGQFTQAEAKVDEEFRIAQKDSRQARMVELSLSRMSIALHGDNVPAAARALSQAVTMAARRRIVRPFLDQIHLIASLVNDTKPSAWIFVREEERRFFAEICAQLPISDSLQNDLKGNWEPDAGLAVTPTKKETELLSLMNLGLSNQQIAEYSNVSITTIKWHLKNLYRKFGVPNRSAALARARSMRLLSQ